MKKIFPIILAVILLTGCSESFLDKQPESSLSPANYFTNAAEIKTGLIAVYQPLQGIYQHGGIHGILERMADDGTQPFSESTWNNFYKTNGDDGLTFWTAYYKMIVNANNIIDVIDKYSPKNDADKLVVYAYKGEACFLRAFAYFNLVRLYGDLPKVLNRLEDPSSVFGVGRTPKASIYSDVIIPDLEFAAANCYKKGDAALANEGARVTKGTALTFLGEVYLTLNEHANAAAALKRLIIDKEGGTYSLMTDYAKIWLPENKFNSESIFEVNYNVAAGMPSYFYRNMSSVGANLWKISTIGCYYAGCKNLMDEFFAAADWKRYDISLDSGWHIQNNLITPIPLKMMPPLNANLKNYDKIGSDYNYMISRYADALLMYAEALMPTDKNTAVTYVNQVRARVNMDPIAAGDLTIERMLHERRMELTFEGHRYYDLVRTGKAIEYISRDLMSNVDYEKRTFRSEPIPEYQLILPIPVGEIEKDQTLTQNPGY